MMQFLTSALEAYGPMALERQADPAAVDAVLAASPPVVTVAIKPLSAAADETATAQYRALRVLMSRSRWRMIDLSAGERP
jgi:hypothetical protein